MTNMDSNVEAAKALVAHAMVEAEAKHGPLTKNHPRAYIILAEEVGEVAQEILCMTRVDQSRAAISVHRLKAIRELAQVAATSILMMANLLEEDSK